MLRSEHTCGSDQDATFASSADMRRRRSSSAGAGACSCGCRCESGSPSAAAAAAPAVSGWALPTGGCRRACCRRSCSDQGRSAAAADVASLCAGCVGLVDPLDAGTHSRLAPDIAAGLRFRLAVWAAAAATTTPGTDAASDVLTVCAEQSAVAVRPLTHRRVTGDLMAWAWPPDCKAAAVWWAYRCRATQMLQPLLLQALSGRLLGTPAKPLLSPLQTPQPGDASEELRAVLLGAMACARNGLLPLEACNAPNAAVGLLKLRS